MLRLLIIISVVLGYVFLLSPLIIVLAASFAGGDATYIVFPPDSFSFDWYRKLPVEYLHATMVSLVVALAAGLISAVLGVLTAMGIVRGKLPGSSFVKAYFNAPMQIPFVVTGIVFLQFYYVLYGLLGVRLIGNIWGLLGVHVFITLPYVVGTVGAVLERFEHSLEEAALTLGASPWSALWRVTLPVIRPGIVAGVLYAFVVSFGDVPASMFIVSESTTTMPVQLFHALEFDYTPALLALSSVIVVGSVLVIFGLQRILGFDLILREQVGH